MVRKTRRAVVKSTGIAGGAVLAGCLGGDGNGDGDSGGQSVSVAHPAGTTWLPLVVANHLGLWEEHGVELNNHPFTSPSDIYTNLYAGSSETRFSIGTSPMPAARARDRGQNTKIVSKDYGGLYRVLTTSEYDSLEDLRGETFACLPPGSSTDFLMKVVSDSLLGEPFEDFFEVVRMGPPQMLTALLNGDVEAAAHWPPYTTRATVQDDYQVIAPISELYEEGTGHRPFITAGVARQEYLESNREKITNFYNAFHEAINRVFEDENPDLLEESGFLERLEVDTDMQEEVYNDLTGVFPTEFDFAALREDLEFQFSKAVEIGALEEEPSDDIYDFLDL